MGKIPQPMGPSLYYSLKSNSMLQRQILLVATFLICFYFISQLTPHSIAQSLDHKGSELLPASLFSSSSSSSSSSSLSSSYPLLPESKYAYAAFLAAPEKESLDDNDDNYFVATRILAYQLLRDPVTRTKQNIPFLVLVTNEVHERKRERLRLDGATVVEVEKLSFDWIQASRNRWRDVLAKLRLFELTQYERIFFMDSDMLIAKCMDGIFTDPASVVVQNANRTERMRDDEGPQPSSYVFAGVSGQGGYDHPFPPRAGRACNAGFILFRPSLDLFNHYMSVLDLPDRFDSKYPEQNLWNYVHRKEGNMPWAQLTTTWNVNWPTMKDYTNGVATLHSKFWDPGPENDLRDVLLRGRWITEGSGEALDEMADITWSHIRS